MTKNNMSHVTTKPVFGVSDQVYIQTSPGYGATEINKMLTDLRRFWASIPLSKQALLKLNDMDKAGLWVMRIPLSPMCPLYSYFLTEQNSN